MKSRPQAQMATPDIPQSDTDRPMRALDLLERPGPESGVKLGGQPLSLRSAPIPAGWVLDGKPEARNTVLSRSADGMARTLIWDCTAGRFNWYYDVDETLYVLEGSVVIKESTGNLRCLNAGDMIFFPAGSHAEWNIESYIRKIAFCREPLSGSVQLFQRVYQRVCRLFGASR